MQRSASQPSYNLPSLTPSLTPSLMPSHARVADGLQPGHHAPNHAPHHAHHAPHHALHGHRGGPAQHDGFVAPIERAVSDAALRIAAATRLCVDPREVRVAFEAEANP